MFPTDNIPYCTARIECDKPNGKRSVGTGFFVLLCENDGASVPMLVTNRHVVFGATRVRFCLTVQKKNEYAPDLGKVHWLHIDQPNMAWIYHPNCDLAMIPVAPLTSLAAREGKPLYFSNINKSMIPTDEDLEDMPNMAEIVLVGYPNGIWDEFNNQPIFRRGIAATHPKLRYNGKPEFLIDAACFNGSSGSPVFRIQVGQTISRKSGIDLGKFKAELLGVLYSGPQHTVRGELVVQETGQKSIFSASIPNNLGLVVSAREIFSLEPLVKFVRDNERLPNRTEACPCMSEKRFKTCCGAIYV